MAQNFGDFEEDDTKFFEICEKSYASVRSFLNTEIPHTMQQIREEWPIIFSKKAIYWHFNKLTNADIHLLNNINDKSEKIIKFIYQRLKHPQKENEGNQEDITMRVLKALSLYFKDSLEVFFIECEVS